MAKTTLTPAEFAQRFAGREFPVECSGGQRTIATGLVASKLMRGKGVLRAMSAKALVCGTVGSTVLELSVNGAAAIASITIDNADVDGTQKSAGVNPSVALNPGDIVEINCTTAPTAGSGLGTFADIVEDFEG
jgi:hypothetical protein